MATTGLTHELRRVDWNAAEWRASLLCLPAIAISLGGALATGHRFAALVIAGTGGVAGRTPERSTAAHRVVVTAIAGVVAMVLHSLYVRGELRRIAHSLGLSVNRSAP